MTLVTGTFFYHQYFSFLTFLMFNSIDFSLPPKPSALPPLCPLHRKSCHRPWTRVFGNRTHDWSLVDMPARFSCFRKYTTRLFIFEKYAPPPRVLSCRIWSIVQGQTVRASYQLSISLHEVPVYSIKSTCLSHVMIEHVKVVNSSVRSDHKAIVAYNGNIKTAVTKSRTAKVYRKVTPAQHASFFCRMPSRLSMQSVQYGGKSTVVFV